MAAVNGWRQVEMGKLQPIYVVHDNGGPDPFGCIPPNWRYYISKFIGWRTPPNYISVLLDGLLEKPLVNRGLHNFKFEAHHPESP
jgi:hypothetical protein